MNNDFAAINNDCCTAVHTDPTIQSDNHIGLNKIDVDSGSDSDCENFVNVSIKGSVTGGQLASNEGTRLD